MAETTRTGTRPRVFLDVVMGQEPAGRLTIELFADPTCAPKTAENFRQLCTGEHAGLSYEKVPFHRVIDEFMIQGGDVQKHDGTGITSIYGGEAFEDENLGWREIDAAGLVCSANRGRDTNGSQFFITLEPCPHLNGKHTVFGRVISGEDTLQRIAKVSVDKNDKPVEPVLISRCGELGGKGKSGGTSQHESRAAQSTGDERGRRRKSDPSDDETSGTPPPRKGGRRSRRQSDNVIDEGIRGRPRLRSVSRSSSNPIEEAGEASTSEQLHKRKRSASPSRRLDRREEEGGEEEDRRRRRSLPNQYRDKPGRGTGDADRYRPSPRRDDRQHPSGRRDNGRYRHRNFEEGRLGDDGRLGGGGGYDDYGDGSVKFKGRGVMKYREQSRAW